MRIDSPQFGSLEVETNKVIEFPVGIPGFEECKKFTLLEVEGHQQEVAVLQSVDQPDVAFSVTTPDLLGLEYAFTLSEEEEKIIGGGRPEDVAVMLILRQANVGEAPSTEASALCANLMGPLVINVATLRGMQKVIARLGCDVTLRPAD